MFEDLPVNKWEYPSLFLCKLFQLHLFKMLLMREYLPSLFPFSCLSPNVCIMCMDDKICRTRITAGLGLYTL